MLRGEGWERRWELEDDATELRGSIGMVILLRFDEPIWESYGRFSPAREIEDDRRASGSLPRPVLSFSTSDLETERTASNCEVGLLLFFGGEAETCCRWLVTGGSRERRKAAGIPARLTPILTCLEGRLKTIHERRTSSASRFNERDS